MSKTLEEMRAAFSAPELLIPQPLTYHVIVRPKRPKTQTSGGIILAKRTQNAELAAKTIGQIVAKGALAWLARTEGLDFADDPVAGSIHVGDWVAFRQHAGQKLRVRTKTGDDDEAGDEFLLIMADTEILAKMTAEQAEQFYDWV